ncbi:MAG: ATP-binding protein [Candidatus Sumerlaeia bacterium]|nr:ATP-binding protein [Candidatus Sumerlaeia bacterium]
MSSELPAVVKITDAHLNDLYTNRVLAELSGYAQEELERIGWINIVDPLAQSLFEEISRSLEHTPYIRECFETNITCRDGSSRTLAWEVVALSPDQFPLMLITARESPQQKLSGAGVVRLRETAALPSVLWEEAFNALPDCVSIHDENFTILAANQALCERLGLPQSEIVGRKCHEVFHGLGQPVEHCVQVCALAMRDGKRARREAYERMFKGICQAEAAPFSSGRFGFRAVVHTLRTPESAGHAASSAFSQRELDSLSRLAGAVAHDYNNLLSGVVGYTGMLQMLNDLPPKAKMYVAELQKAAAHMNEMTQRLLLFGRDRILRPQQFDLNQLVADALRAPDVVAADRTVHAELPPGSLLVAADPFQLRVALGNLVQNALEATAKAGGEVVVRTVLRRAPKAFPTFFAVAPAGNYACLEVRDTGPGIAPDRLVHIFEPFSQKEGRPAGRGLGLAMVYRIVRNHNGYIEADSEVGVGTRVSILLPTIG